MVSSCSRDISGRERPLAPSIPPRTAGLLSGRVYEVLSGFVGSRRSGRPHPWTGVGLLEGSGDGPQQSIHGDIGSSFRIRLTNSRLTRARSELAHHRGATAGHRTLPKRPRLRSNSSSWIVKTIQTAKVHGLDDERMGVPATEGLGAGAEGQVTIPERVERACVSLDARDRAGMGIRSSRRLTTRTSD